MLHKALLSRSLSVDTMLDFYGSSSINLGGHVWGFFFKAIFFSGTHGGCWNLGHVLTFRMRLRNSLGGLFSQENDIHMVRTEYFLKALARNPRQW